MKVKDDVKPIKTTLYQTAELQRMIEQIQTLVGPGTTMAGAITAAAKEFVQKRADMSGFERITILGYFDRDPRYDPEAPFVGTEGTIEKRVFTGRWIIPVDHPFELNIDRYAAALSQKGKWVLLRWDIAVGSPFDHPSVQVYDSLELMKHETPSQVIEALVNTQTEMEWDI